MKERFTNVAQKTLDVFVKFASTKAITALKDGFVLSMPITLVGSIFLLIANLPITGYTDFMARIFGSDWNLGLNQINNSTFNVLAMVIAVGIGYSYARNEKMDGCLVFSRVAVIDKKDVFHEVSSLWQDWSGSRGRTLGRQGLRSYKENYKPLVFR